MLSNRCFFTLLFSKYSLSLKFELPLGADSFTVGSLNGVKPILLENYHDSYYFAYPILSSSGFKKICLLQRNS